MSERYPDDATLLNLASDPATGVEYIPTGRSPYYLEFRKLIQRLNLAAQRANDFRVYQEGDLTIGVRPGRCSIHNTVRDFAGVTGQALASSATTHIWVDGAGALQVGTAGLPADRTAFLPLAEVITGTLAIESLTDLRGEAFLGVPDLASLGVTAPLADVNQALDGINASVTSLGLNILTGGPESTADTQHRHLEVSQDANEEVYYLIINQNGGASANVGLVFGLPNRLADDIFLLPNVANGFLSQRFNGVTYNLVGTSHASYRSEGNLTASQTGKLVGIVPITGVVSDVILSHGSNIASSVATDGIQAVAKVNGATLTTTHPKITSAAGAGFRSTARGQGTAAVVKSDGTQNVQKGDVLTVDLTRTASGSVSTEAANVVVMVVIRAGSPE